MPPKIIADSSCWYRLRTTPLSRNNSSHSPKVRGSTRIRAVARLCKAPRSAKRCLTIHDVAEPQTTTISRGALDAYSFQGSPNDTRKSEPRVSNQGNSSRKTTWRPVAGLEAR